MRHLPLARSAGHRRRRKSGRRSSPSRLPPIPGAAPVPTTPREMAAPAGRAARGAARAVMRLFATSATSAMTWCAGGGRRMPPPAVLRCASVVRQAQRHERLIPALYLLPDADKLACRCAGASPWNIVPHFRLRATAFAQGLQLPCRGQDGDVDRMRHRVLSFCDEPADGRLSRPMAITCATTTGSRPHPATGRMDGVRVVILHWQTIYFCRIITARIAFAQM